MRFPEHTRSVRLARALYALCARMLPDHFRSRFDDEMSECFAQIAADARQRGRLAIAVVTVRAIADLIVRAPGLHAASRRFAIPRRRTVLSDVSLDLRDAARRLHRRPSYTVATVFTLALGIGAAATVYGLVHHVVLRSLPYPDAARIVQIDHGGSGLGIDRGLGVTYGFYRFYASHLRSVEAIAMYDPSRMTLVGEGEPVQLEGVRVTPSLIDVLRVQPRLGRWFSRDEAVARGAAVVVLSDALWRERFGGDARVLGRRLELDGISHEIIGVMPASFAFPSRRATYWVPRVVAATGIGGWNHEAVGRLASGADAAALEREIVSLFPRIRASGEEPALVAAYLDEARVYPRVITLRESIVGNVRATLLILLGTVGLVLLIAIANVANLVLVRAEERHREMALRAALGADRARLARASLAETVLLALTGGTIGLGAAAVGLRVLRERAPVNIPRLEEVTLGAEVIGVVLAVTLVAGLAIGAAPALRPMAELGGLLKEGSRRSTAGRRTLRGRNVLVAAQVALALVLLIGSGLLFRTFAALRAVDLGFAQRRALVFDLGLPASRYADRAAATAFNERLLERLRAVPGVESAAAVAECLPLSGHMCWGEVLAAEGRPPVQGGLPPVTGTRVVTSDYFRTLGIPVRGRAFDSADERGDTHSAILSEAAADAYFGDDDPVGRRVRFGDGERWLTIIGVAGDVRARVESEEFTRLIYLPMRADNHSGPTSHRTTWVLATAMPPAALAAAARETLHELDPTLPMALVRPLEEIIDATTAPTAFALTLIGIGAAVALLLGAVGVYAVVSYAVSRRTNEIGVRRALGARVADVQWMILRQGGAVVLAGVAAGLLGAVVLTRVMHGMLHGVSPTDPVSYAALTAVMLVVAGLALWIPARRASRVDPTEALRSD